MSEISPQALEAIKMAIQLEKDGRAFYEQAAQKTKHKLAKKMFETLAKDEIDHLHTFQKMFDSLIKPDEWKELTEKPSKVGKVPVFQGEARGIGDVDPNEIEALRTARENEKKSIDFFNEVAEETGDPLAKRIFTKIKQEEEYHYDLLQAQLDYVTNSGFWFDIAEFRMDARY